MSQSICAYSDSPDDPRSEEQLPLHIGDTCRTGKIHFGAESGDLRDRQFKISPDGEEDRSVLDDQRLRAECKRIGLTLFKDFASNSLDPRYSANVRLSRDRMSVTGRRNWGSALSRGCCSWGSWYFEVTVDSLGVRQRSFGNSALQSAYVNGKKLFAVGSGGQSRVANFTSKHELDVASTAAGSSSTAPAVRIGWGSRLSHLQAPIGSNVFGYALSSYSTGSGSTLCSDNASECCYNLPSIDASYPVAKMNCHASVKRRNCLFTVTNGVRSKLRRVDVQSLNCDSLQRRDEECNSLVQKTYGQPHRYLAPGLQEGDIVGCYIHLPGRPSVMLDDPRGMDRLWPFLQQGLLCDVTNELTLPEAVVYPDSYVSFSVNGCYYARCISPLFCMEFHPAISVFNGAKATINLGPKFVHLSADDHKIFKPACLMGDSMYPLKLDLAKFWILSTEPETRYDVDTNEKSTRLKTLAEAEGLKGADESVSMHSCGPHFSVFDELKYWKKVAPQRALNTHTGDRKLLF